MAGWMGCIPNGGEALGLALQPSISYLESHLSEEEAGKVEQ